MSRVRRPAAARPVPRGPAGVGEGGVRVSAGDVAPGSVVLYAGRRLHVAAVNLAGRVALEEHGRSLSGASTWISLDEPVEVVEPYRPPSAALGVGVDPLLGA